MSVEKLFLDTNVFIHLKDLKDLPWREAFPDASEINLVIVEPAVVEELDELKTHPNRRKSNRARSALKVIEEASRQETFSLVLRDNSPIIRISLESGVKMEWERFPNLVAGKADHIIVANALMAESGARLFTCDTGPRITARRHNLAVFEPPKSWFLPHEASEESKRIKLLEQQVSELQQSKPIIALTLPEGTVDGVLTLVRPVLSPLEEPLVRAVAEKYLAEHPRKNVPYARTDIESLMNSAYGNMVSASEFNNYAAKYQKFGQVVHEHLRELHERVYAFSLSQAFTIGIENESSVSAEAFRIEVEVSDPLSLVADRWDAESWHGSLKLPTPPEPPEPSSTHLHHTLRSNFTPFPEPPDPTEFQWVERPQLMDRRSVSSCQEFHAKRIYDELVWVHFDTPDEPVGTLKLIVKGKNLPAPESISLQVRLEEQETDWANPTVLALLPDFLRENISSL